MTLCYQTPRPSNARDFLPSTDTRPVAASISPSNRLRMSGRPWITGRSGPVEYNEDGFSSILDFMEGASFGAVSGETVSVEALVAWMWTLISKSDGASRIAATRLSDTQFMCSMGLVNIRRAEVALVSVPVWRMTQTNTMRRTTVRFLLAKLLIG